MTQQSSTPSYTIMMYEKIRDQNELLGSIDARLSMIYREADSINDKMHITLMMVATAFVVIFICSLINIYAAVVFLKTIGSLP